MIEKVSEILRDENSEVGSEDNDENVNNDIPNNNSENSRLDGDTKDNVEVEEIPKEETIEETESEVEKEESTKIASIDGHENITDVTEKNLDSVRIDQDDSIDDISEQKRIDETENMKNISISGAAELKSYLISSQTTSEDTEQEESSNSAI